MRFISLPFTIILFFLLCQIAQAQWREVKDVNGQVHSIYTIPVASPKNNNFQSSTKVRQSSGSYVDDRPSPANTYDNYKKIVDTRTADEKKMYSSIFLHDYEGFYKVYNNPDAKFTKGRGLPLAYLMGTMCEDAVYTTEELPLIYGLYLAVKAYSERYGEDFSYNYFTLFEITKFSAIPFVVARACIYEKDYRSALSIYETSTYFGKDPDKVKKDADQAETKRFINYINYFAGRCYEEIGEKDNGARFLGIGKSCKSDWNKLIKKQ